MMVKLYRSQSKKSLQNLKEDYKYAIEIPLKGKKSWHGFKEILNYTKEKKPGKYAEIFEQHEPFLSLFDKGVANSGSDKVSIIARESSHLTHNWFIQEPIFKQCITVLQKVLSQLDTLLVTNLFELDPETLVLLVKLIKEKDHPNLILGYININENQNLDENGIQWGWSLFERENIVLRFFYCDDFQVIDLPSFEEYDNSQSLNEIETFSYKQFEERYCKWKNSFYLFGFTQVLFDGIALISFIENDESGRGKIDHLIGEIYSLTALAAHNRQFTSKGNQILAEFIEMYLKKALSCDLSHELRAANLYRLAVLYGRRKKRFQESLDVCNQMIEFLNDVELSPYESLYQLGWAYNIRAYNNQFLGLKYEARLDIERSQKFFEELKELTENSGSSIKSNWIRDVLKSNTLPLYNKSKTLSSRIEKNEQTKKIFQFHDSNPITDLNEAENKLIYYKVNHDLANAIVWARKGIERSIKSHRAFNEQYFRGELMDLYYRIGDLKASIKELNIIENNIIKFHNPYTMPDISLSTVMLKLRAKKFLSVFKILDEHIEKSDDDAVKAELYAVRYLAGVMSAKEFDLIVDKNTSIALADESGDASVIIKVASIIGQGLYELGMEYIDELKEVYSTGIEIVDYGIKEKINMPLEHSLNIIVGYQEIFGLNHDKIEFINDNVEKFLRISESWWVMARLLKLIKSELDELPNNIGRFFSQRVDLI